MAFLAEKAIGFLGKRASTVKEHFVGTRTFDLRIASLGGSQCPLRLGPVHCGKGTCCPNVGLLDTVGVGEIVFENEGEHGGAIELFVGVSEERLLIGQYTKAGISTFFGDDKFVVSFPQDEKLKLADFYLHMPKEFVGRNETHSVRVEGKDHCVLVSQCYTGDRCTEVYLTIGTKDFMDECASLHKLDATEHLALAAYCNRFPELKSLVSNSLFLGDFVALSHGFREMDSRSRAFAADFIVKAFVEDNLLENFNWDDHKPACDSWRNSRQKLADGQVLPWKLSAYEKLEEGQLDRHFQSTMCLLKSLELHCIKKLQPAVQHCRPWPPEDITGLLETNEMMEPGAHAFDNAQIIVSHVSRRGSIVDDAPVGSPDFLKRLVQTCIDASAKFNMSRGHLFEEFVKGKAEVDRYSRIQAVSKRRFKRLAAGDSAEAEFIAFSSEMFSGSEAETSPSSVLKSLGVGSGDYKALTTNSKSGEFFFLSHDGKYLIKTVSEAEGLLLYKMLPKYQEHLEDHRNSLVSRFAGLFSVALPGDGKVSWKYFVVMCSVFEPGLKIHTTYDLKGSTHNRKKKEGESTGKDEDWVMDKQRLRIEDDARRELLAVHEADLRFLIQFHVMDYSLLVGIHNVEDKNCKHNKGIWSVDKQHLYFVGLIDFLIAFKARKEAENLIRSAQGHGETASCIDPEAYALRQVDFVREAIVEEQAMKDGGTAGTLKIHVKSAKNLINADYGINNKSDPYCRARIGLHTDRTAAIEDNLNPSWDCWLRLPVNKEHLEEDVVLSLWDEDEAMLNGSDDHLGSLPNIPMKDLAKKKELSFIDEILQGVKHGTFTVELFFDAVGEGNDRGFDPPPRSSSSGSPIWEFSVRDGFTRFGVKCQRVLEDHYQAFTNTSTPGPSSVTVDSSGRSVTVNFEKMEQYGEGGRVRDVRRRAP